MKALFYTTVFTLLMGLNGVALGQEPDTEESDIPSVGERGRMGLEAYTRVMDALDVPDEQRVIGDQAIERSGAPTLVDAMERAREAQREALQGEEARFGYLDGED